MTKLEGKNHYFIQKKPLPGEALSISIKNTFPKQRLFSYFYFFTGTYTNTLSFR